MSKKRIGGVVVADGGSVKWGVLASVIVGAPIYASFEGIVGLVIGFREFLIDELLGGVRSFVVTLIDLEITIGVAAIDIAWMEFWSSVRAAGVFAWWITVIAVALVILVFILMLRKGVRAIA